ncbi:MAG: ATP-binding cassette domain-containing protein [Pirellula sp.]
MLVLDSLTKDFAARAVDSVSLEFQAGQVHALVGANGAGKSRLATCPTLRIMEGEIQRTPRTP